MRTPAAGDRQREFSCWQEGGSGSQGKALQTWEDGASEVEDEVVLARERVAARVAGADEREGLLVEQHGPDGCRVAPHPLVQARQ